MRVLAPFLVAATLASSAAWADPGIYYYRFVTPSPGSQPTGGQGSSPGDGTSPTPGQNGTSPSGAITLTPSSQSVIQGGSAQSVASGPTGTTFTLDGSYPGVTLTPGGALTAVAGAVGQTQIGVIGTWTGGSATATFTLTSTQGHAWVGNAMARSGQTFSLGLTTDVAAAGSWTATSASGDVSGLSTTPNQAPANSATAWGTAPSNPGPGNLSRALTGTYTATGAGVQVAGQGTLTVYPPLSLSPSASRYVLAGSAAAIAAPARSGQIGNLSWSLSSGGTPVTGALPGACSGLTFNPAAGTISGTPAQGCTASLSYVAADDGNGVSSLSATSAPAASQVVAIQPGMALTFPNGGKLAAVAGSTGTSIQPTITGGCPPLNMATPSPALPFGISQAYSAGTYPLGTIFTDGSGAGAGTSAPTTIQVNDSCGQSATATIQSDIQAVAASVAAPTQLALPVGSAGSTNNPAVAGFGSGLTFDLASGTLPGYLSVTPSTGAIAGTVPAGTASGTTWTVSVRARDSFGRSQNSPSFTVSLAPPTASTAYTLPILDSQTNFLSNTPITVARLYDGKNTYVAQGQLPQMWCSGTSTCEVVMHWTEPKLWNVMMILGTASTQPNGWVVSYDNGDGVWRQLWTGTYEIIDKSAPDNAFKVTFPDTVITRVKVSFPGYPGGWGHLDEWRFGYNTAPAVP